MARHRFSLAAAAFLLLFTTAGARPVRVWNGDELAARSAVVANGLVLEVSSDGPAAPKTLLSNKPVPQRAFRARIKILAAFQGKPPATLTVRYTGTDMKKVPMIANGPLEISLEKGKRYRFYLNPAPDGDGYVGALAGEFDDGNAVQPLAPGVADNAKPITEQMAVKAARAYVEARWPAARPFPIHTVASADAPGWIVEFFSREAYTYAPFIADASVRIAADGTAAPDSWVALAFVSPASADAALVGKQVRIMTGLGQQKGQLWEVRGVVRGIAPETLDVDGASPLLGLDPSRLPRADISSLQILAP